MGVPLPGEGVGIAGLLSADMHHNITTQGSSKVLNQIFEADVQLQHAGQEEIDYQHVDTWLQQHVAELQRSAAVQTQASDAASSSAAAALPAQPPGRLGPADVVVDRGSVCGQFSYSSDGMTIESLGNFSSCRANVAVFKGKWMYECTVLTPGIQQIGWATIHCPFTAEEGVGDASDSYAVDGKRQRKWSVKPQPYGEPWVQGDVMGCALDLDTGSLTFYRNGASMGVAYDRIRTMQPSLAYFPAVSLSHTERCCLNFGGKPFVYPVEGYQPLHAPPCAAEQAVASYYCSCLGRLVRLAAEQQGSSSSSGGGSSMLDAAAGTAAAAVQGAALHFPASSSKAQDDMQRGIASAAAAPASPSAAVAAAAAAERLGLGYPTSCSPRQSRSGSWCPPFAASATSAVLSSADVVLLAALLLEPLEQQLVLQPYLVHSALLPLLLELQQEGEVAGQQRPLQLLLQLALVVWQQQGFTHIVMTLLQNLAYRCQVSPLLAQEFPNTAGFPYLALAVSLLRCPAVMRLLAGHGDFCPVLEGLLARKSPSPKDLQVLLPHVWWPGCKDETASEERLRASVSVITATLSKVEQCQAELMELLLATPFQQSSSSGSSSAAAEDDDCALLVFLRFLLQKNRSALRDVPPPGLSEPTVIMSTFFGLLRLLQPALRAAQEQGSGPLAAFPAAELLAGSGPSAEAQPVFDVPRLGGTISHLAREHPTSELEQQPVQVLQQQQQQQLGSSSGGAEATLLKDAWVPELLNSCMLLYAWRVGFSYKMIHSLSSSVASSSATLDELDRMIAESSEALQSSSWLLGTRKVYREELTRDVRLLTLLRAAFFSPAKQQALSTLSRYLAMLLTNIADIPAATQLAEPAAAAAAAHQPAADSSSAADSASAAAAAAATAAGSSTSSGDEDDQSHLSNLLRYVPVVYVEVVVDYLTALGRLDEQQPGAGSQAQPAGARAYVTWLCGCLNDPRIANPDVQESLLQVVGLLLDHPGWRSVLEAQPGHAHQLLAALLVTFDSRLWHPASGVLLKVIKDCGFGHAAFGVQPPHGSLQRLLLGLLEEGSKTPATDTTAAAATASDDAEAASASAAARVRGFLNKLFNTLNWTLTEFSVSVDDLHNLRGRRSILEAQNQYRRTGLMFELSVNFLRILEFTVPTHAFLGSSVNRTRLRELLQFALSHFTNGPDAHRLNELLQASQAPAAGSSGGGAAAAPAAGSGAAASSGAAGPPRAGAALAAAVPAYAASAMRFESSSLSERVQKPVLLAPLMGMLLAIWNAHSSATAAAAGNSSAAAAGAEADVLDELVQMADERFMSSLQFMQDVDWSAAFPSTPLSSSLRAFGQLLDALAAARAAHESSAAAAPLPEEVPDEFTDPITMDIMREPVRLPDSQIVVDRSTIERHLLSSETDPFSRAPLKLQQLQPDEEMKARIQQWLAKCRQQQQQQRAAADS